MAPDKISNEEVLNSLEGLKKAVANPFLYEKIKHRLDTRHREIRGASMVQWAMVLAIIVILNVLTWTQVSNATGNENRVDSIASQLGFTSTSYQY